MALCSIDLLKSNMDRICDFLVHDFGDEIENDECCGSDELN